MTNRSINLATIRVDGGTQSRVALNPDTVAEYRDALADGDDLPPITLFFDGADHWLADGFHRYHAYRDKGRASIPADVRAGTQRDAILHSCGANAQHGLQRTNADKHRAIAILLADAEWATWSDSAIARACNVHHETVAAHRKDYLAESQDTGKRLVERGGTTYEQDTSNIGKRPPSAPSAPTPSDATPKPLPTPKGPTAAEQEADTNAEEAHGGTDLAELLEETQQELEAAQRQLAVAGADDLKSEAMKWHRIADIATRRQNELQQTVVDREAEIKRHVNALRRIGKLVGEDNPSRVAATVEEFVRTTRVPA